MATPTESKIVSLHEPEDDVSFSVTLGQLSVKPEVPWNEEMQALLENLHLNSIIQDLEYYIKSLRTHLNKLIDQPTWEKLPGLILSHLQTIKTKMYGKNIKLNSAISRLLEEIMSIYGTVELNVVALLSKDNDSKLSKSKQLLNCSKQILSKLKYTFYWSDVNVVHCLIKMKFDRKTTSSVSIMKYMYQNVLFNNKISKLDDLTLCGYYLLFCKYKRFISSSDHSQMLRKLFNRFDKRISYLNNFETLHEILCFDSGVTADLNTAKGRVQMITNYFKYIKDREKLDEPQDKSMINDYDKFGKDDFNTYYDCYETSSQDERTISFVDSCEMDQTETENSLNSTQDEKKIYLVESAEEFTENISTDLSTGQSSDGIKVEENIATDLSTGQSSGGIKVEENQELQEEEIQNEICDFDIDVAEVEIVTKVESVDLTESTIDLTLNEDVDECVIQMVEIRKQANQVDEPVEIAFSDDTKIEDQTCDHQAENHLIHQLQEYLSISKPETISLSQDVQDSIEQPINSSDDNHHNDANEESGKYLFEFGYETPPKDVNGEQEFTILPTQVHIEPDLIRHNGFLTPENEIVCPLAPDQYISTIPPLNNERVDCLVDIEDSMLNSGQYNDTPPLYSIPGVTIHYDDAVTLDLSNKSRRNSGDGDTDQISNTDCQRNASRGKKAITFNSDGVAVCKYYCNEELIGHLTMPSIPDVLLEASKLHENKEFSPFSRKKSRKQLISCLDMNVDRAYVELSRIQNQNKNRKRLKHILPNRLNYDSIPTSDPKLFQMKPVVDLSSFRPCDLSNMTATTAPKNDEIKQHEIKIETSEKPDADILKAIHKNNYTEEEISLLVQAVKTGTETRLPFKKRRMAVPEEETTEISYPATPMVSIAELTAIQPTNGLLPLPPVHNGRSYLAEIPLEPEAAVEVNYNLNTYAYSFVPCGPTYFEMNSLQPVHYCMDGFDSKENLDMNVHYFQCESDEP